MERIIGSKYILGGIVITTVLVFIILFVETHVMSKDSSVTGSIISSYSEDKEIPFSLPPLGRNPYEKKAADDLKIKQWLQKQTTDNTVATTRFNVYPFEDMRKPENARTIWLGASQPFRGIIVIQPFFNNSFGTEQDFAIKAILDGQEIKFSADKGLTPSSTLLLHLKSAEYKELEIETENLPQGKHSLSFMGFYYIYNKNEDIPTRNILGDLSFSSQFYQVFVASTQTPFNIDFSDWSQKMSPFPSKFVNSFNIVDNENSKDGLTIWQPKAFNPGEIAQYDVLLNNPNSTDREYCLIGFLNYQQTLIQKSNKLACGIVRGGQLGRFSSSLVLPVTPGIYQFQIIRFENPLMKSSYYSAHPETQLKQLVSSARILIKTTK